MRDVNDIVHRAEHNMYVMSCYLTKDDLYNDMRADFYNLVDYVLKQNAHLEKLEGGIETLDLWDRIEEVTDEM